MCGALVLWQDVVERPHMIDVAIGLLDDEYSGARAKVGSSGERGSWVISKRR